MVSRIVACFKARLLAGAVMPEQKKKELVNKHKVTIEKVDELLALDPTPTGSWMNWLIKWDKAGELAAIAPQIESMIQKYERMKVNWPGDDPRRNFGRLTPEQLQQIVKGDRRDRRGLSREELTRQLFEEGMPGAEMIIKDGPWKMWKVSNPKTN